MGLSGVSEYLFTMGILVAFIGTIVSVALGRRHFAGVLRKSGIKWRHLVLAVIIAAGFLAAELYMVKPTQLLFFDDAIYQAGAVSLLHSGQAWMCNYGTPTACLSGQIFHEPIGTSFLLAIGFAISGVHLAVTYNTMLVVTLVAVLMAFLVGSLMLDDPVAGLFTEMIVGLSPIVLVWARPTTSDMPMLALSLVAVFTMLVFMKRKSIYTFLAMLLSLALVTYTKVDALLYVPVIFIMFLILDRDGIKKNAKLFAKNILEPAFLIAILLFAVAVLPEAIYTYTQAVAGNYGAAGSYIQNTCNMSAPSVPVSSSIGPSNFGMNICANALFWLGTYSDSYVMQPLVYTLLAVAGVALMLVWKRKTLAALAVWFAAFFAMYTSFYAGSVLFGIDWRFMLALIPPMAILGGYAASLSYAKGAFAGKGMARKIGRMAAYAVMTILIVYPVYAAYPMLAINPSNIQQAGDARFYEGFVYNSSKAVPTQCLIFSYDPTLMIINGHTSTQLGDLYPSSYQTFKSEYPCLVVDWGYWCYTPDNTCTYVGNTFTLSSIANATYAPLNRTYGFYYVTGLKGRANSSG